MAGGRALYKGQCLLVVLPKHSTVTQRGALQGGGMGFDFDAEVSNRGECTRTEVGCRVSTDIGSGALQGFGGQGGGGGGGGGVTRQAGRQAGRQAQWGPEGESCKNMQGKNMQGTNQPLNRTTNTYNLALI